MNIGVQIRMRHYLQRIWRHCLRTISERVSPSHHFVFDLLQLFYNRLWRWNFQNNLQEVDSNNVTSLQIKCNIKCM